MLTHTHTHTWTHTHTHGHNEQIASRPNGQITQGGELFRVFVLRDVIAVFCLLLIWIRLLVCLCVVGGRGVILLGDVRVIKPLYSVPGGPNTFTLHTPLTTGSNTTHTHTL